MVARLDVATVNVENYRSFMNGKGWSDNQVEHLLSTVHEGWFKNLGGFPDLICRINTVQQFNSKLYASNLGMTYTQGWVSVIVNERTFRDVTCRTFSSSVVQGVKITAVEKYLNKRISFVFAAVIFPDRTDATCDAVRSEVCSMLESSFGEKIKNDNAVFNNLFKACSFKEYADLFDVPIMSRFTAYKDISVMKCIDGEELTKSKITVEPYLHAYDPVTTCGFPVDTRS